MDFELCGAVSGGIQPVTGVEEADPSLVDGAVKGAGRRERHNRERHALAGFRVGLAATPASVPACSRGALDRTCI